MCHGQGFGYNWQGRRPFWRQWYNWNYNPDVVIPYAYGELDEDKGIYNITVELPGVEKKDIDIKASAQSIRVNATRSNVSSEQTSNKFKRHFQFRYQIDPAKVVASYNNGLLKLEVPLVPESSTHVNIT